MISHLRDSRCGQQGFWCETMALGWWGVIDLHITRSAAAPLTFIYSKLKSEEGNVLSSGERLVPSCNRDICPRLTASTIWERAIVGSCSNTDSDIRKLGILKDNYSWSLEIASRNIELKVEKLRLGFESRGFRSSLSQASRFHSRVG